MDIARQASAIAPRVPKSSDLKCLVNVQDIPSIGGYELPLEQIESKWISSEDAEHTIYYYNSATKVSAWNNPEEYCNRRKYRAYLCVIERPLLLSMGEWRFHKFE